MSQELKPCPFCGKPAERKTDDYKVACSDAGTCPASMQWSDPDDWNERFGNFKQEEVNALYSALAAARADRERLTNEIGLHLSWMEDAGQVFHGIMRDESLPRGLRDQAAKMIQDFDEYSAALSSPLPAEEAKKCECIFCGEVMGPGHAVRGCRPAEGGA